MALDMGREYGYHQKTMAITMKENIRMIKNLALENIDGHLVAFLEVILKMTCAMDMVKCFGWMAVYKKVINKINLINYIKLFYIFRFVDEWNTS